MKNDWEKHLRGMANLAKFLGEDGSLQLTLGQMSRMTPGPKLEKKRARLLVLVEQAALDFKGISQLSARQPQIEKIEKCLKMLALFAEILRIDWTAVRNEV